MLSPQPRRPPAQSAGNVGPELGTSRQSLPPYPNVARLEPCTEGRAPSIRYPDVDRAIESSPRCSRIDPFLAVVLPFEANTHRNRGTVLERGPCRLLIADLLPVPPGGCSPTNRFVHAFYYAPGGGVIKLPPKIPPLRSGISVALKRSTAALGEWLRSVRRSQSSDQPRTDLRVAETAKTRESVVPAKEQ